MLTTHFRQALALLRQDRLFSAVYVVGTGLAIALTMTLCVVVYVKIAPIYPEYNRDRMVVLKYVKCHPAGRQDTYSAAGLSPDAADLLGGLPHLADMARTCRDADDVHSNLVALPGRAQAFEAYPLYVDAGFWKVFTLHFLSGGPFTAAHLRARSRTAVVSESMARRLFATTDAAGRTFVYKGHTYTVSGVVRDVSSATPDAVADVWLPLPFLPMASYRDSARGSLLGNLTYYLTAPEPADRTMLKEEVCDAFRRYNAGREWVADIMGQPDDAALAPLRTEPAQAPDTARMLRSLLFIVAALLFIPALNLSGMIASRMDSRMAELGIRKAYGATRGVLLAQILWENLVLTALGALLGLLFCCLIVFVSGTWILTLLDANTMLDLPAPFLTLEMLLNPWIFLCALCLCLVLNVASALVPAWWGLRRSIVQELYMKR